MSESQICQKCGTSRPIEQFQLMKGRAEYFVIRLIEFDQWSKYGIRQYL